MEKTYEDGWDCIPELRDVADKIDELDTYKYEINSCVRATELDHMVTEMKYLLEEALHQLENIDTSREFETVVED
tara:strand:+ start:1064 stop:1288 length:225 start_codon:yes stop_codon:yes gene_type:complete